MFIVETPADARECSSAGIFDVPVGRLECENCSMSIGVVSDGFIPLAVITEIQSLSVWTICIDCATPVIFPGEWSER